MFRLQLQQLFGMAREHLLVALLVAKPRMGERPEDCEPVGHLGMAGQELADANPLGPGCDRAERDRESRRLASGLGS